MNLTGDQFLAGPRLSLDQDREVGRRDTLDPLAHPPDPGPRSDQRRGAIRFADLRPASPALLDFDEQGRELRADRQRAPLPLVDRVRGLELRLQTDRHRPRGRRDVDGDASGPLAHQRRMLDGDGAGPHERAQFLLETLAHGARLADDRQSTRDRRQQRGRRGIRRGSLRFV